MAQAARDITQKEITSRVAVLQIYSEGGVRTCVQNALPDVLAVVQVALEGAVSKAGAAAALGRGQLPQVRRSSLLV